MNVKRMMISTVAVGLFILFGILFGIQLVSEEVGMFQPVPLTIETPQTDHQQDSVYLELVNKADKAGDIGRFNFFSDLGEGIANGLNQISRAGLSRMISFIHHLNGSL